MPQKLAGILIDPPPSLPEARVHRPAAIAAPAPPLDPPVVREVSQGLRQWSPSRFSVWPSSPSSGVLVLPSMMAPAPKIRRTTSESTLGTRSSNSSEPPVVRTPLVISRSLIETGTPCRGPSSLRQHHNRLLGGLCGPQGVLRQDSQVGVELRVEVLYALEEGPGHLDRRDLLVANQGVQLGGR